MKHFYDKTKEISDNVKRVKMNESRLVKKLGCQMKSAE